MDPNFPPSSLLMFFSLLLLLSHQFRCSLCLDDYHYSNCSSWFECGPVLGKIGFPFWGGKRPEYCGPPSFRLVCEDGDRALIEIKGQKYEVKNINNDSGVLEIVNLNLSIEGPIPCPQKMFMDSTHFEYTDNVTLVNFTLGYNCPPDGYEDEANHYTCKLGEGDGRICLSEKSSDAHKGGSSCKNRSVIEEYPVLKRELERSVDDRTEDVVGLLKAGFEVKWKADQARCHKCIRSGGECGFNGTTNQICCYCRDKPYPDKCSTSILNPAPMLLLPHDLRQMGAKLFFPSSPFFFFVFIAIPVCFCDDKQQYEECAVNLYECGDLKGIGYPFWGGDRPLSCGQQGFELLCQDDDDDDNSTFMRIDSLHFRVLNISQSSYTMTIARTDFWNESCPKDFISTTLNYTLFDYASTNGNLTLFYGCSGEVSSHLPADFTITNNFTCSVEGTGDNTTAFFADEAFVWQYVDVLETCKINVTLPVLIAALDELKANDTEGGAVSNVDRLEKALNKGFEVNYSAVRGLCVQCNESGGICGSSSTSPFTCHCPDNKSHQYACKKSVSPTSKKIILATVGAGVGMLLAIILLIFVRKISKQGLRSMWRKRSDADQNIEEFVKNYGSQAPKRYSYSDVKKMTDSFRDKLGQGGYGSVYKGKLADGKMVAVKVLNTSKGNGEEFINEVASISRTSHVNIVSLLGFCFEGGKKALIYEFMSHGSLENYLCSTDHQDPLTTSKHLGWEKLYDIAVGIARGLEYLHFGCRTRIVHFDVKPHNILLNQDFSPKISDFGLAKLSPPKESILSMSVARGTIGYVAPEVFSRNFGRVSHKSDVYSYGMMLLEMVGGRWNVNGRVDRTSDTYFPHWIYKKLEQQDGLGLEGIQKEEEDEVTRKMILVGLWCIQTDPSQRPGMSKVIEMLEGSLEALQIPPKPYLSSPPRLPIDSSSFNSTPSQIHNDTRVFVT